MKMFLSLTLVTFLLSTSLQAGGCPVIPTSNPADWQCGTIQHSPCGRIDRDGEPRSINFDLTDLNGGDAMPTDLFYATVVVDRLPPGQQEIYVRMCLGSAAGPRFIVRSWDIQLCRGGIVQANQRVFDMSDSDRVLFLLTYDTMGGETPCSPVILTGILELAGSPGQELMLDPQVIRIDSPNYGRLLEESYKVTVGQPLPR
jgi:hypothetical protein